MMKLVISICLDVCIDRPSRKNHGYIRMLARPCYLLPNAHVKPVRTRLGLVKSLIASLFTPLPNLYMRLCSRATDSFGDIERSKMKF